MSTPTVDTEEAFKTDRGVLILKQTMANDFLRAVYQFLKLVDVHDRKNDIFKDAVGRILRTAENWINIPDFGSLDLQLHGDQIFLNEARIRPNPRQLQVNQFLTRYLRQRRLVGFTIKNQSTYEHIEKFFWKLAEIKKDTKASELVEWIHAESLEEFEFKTLTLNQANPDQAKSLAAQIHDELSAFVRLCIDDFDRAKNLENAPAINRLLNELIVVDERDLLNLFCLNPTQRPERPLPTIAANSAFMLHTWGRSLGLPPGVLLELSGAGLAHALMFMNATGGMNPNPLNPELGSLGLSNFEQLKKVWPLTELQTLALFEWAIPFGEKGVYEIGGTKCYQHFFSRMLRIVVLFQKMTTYDARSKQFSPEEALTKLFHPQLGCDPSLVKLFISWLGIYPVGTFVVLNSGEVGQICSTGTDLHQIHRPMVGIFKDKDGKLLDQPEIIDLMEMNEKLGTFRRGIKESVAFETTQIPAERLNLLSGAMTLSMSY